MPDVLAPTDVVPTLRADLNISDPVQGAGEELVNVTDPISGTTMSMRGFELSIARMLNGKRTAQSLVDGAGQIGLPISLEGLGGFIRKLHGLNFLAEAGSPEPALTTTWSVRREWPDDIRKRFQQALREARSNELLQAKEHTEALLRDAPDIVDAKDLLTWIQERLHAPAVGKKLPTFTDVFAAVEKGWFEEGERLSAKNEQAHAEQDGTTNVGTVSHVVKPRGGVLKWVLLAILVLGAGAAALVPLPYKVQVKYELVAKSSANVEAPRVGTVATVVVKDSDWVESGAPLLTYDTEAAKKRLAEAEVRLKDLNKKLTAMTTGNKKVADAKKKLEKAQADLKKATAEVDAALAKAKGNKKNPAVAKAQKKEKAAADAIPKAQKVLDAAGAGDKTNEMRADVDKATAERDALKTQAEAPPMTAPTSGYVSGLKVKAGDVLQPGNAVCKLEDSKVLRVKMSAADKGFDAIQEGQAATLSLAGAPVAVKVDRVLGGEASGSLDNAKGTYKSGAKGEGVVAAGGRSMLGRL